MRHLHLQESTNVAQAEGRRSVAKRGPRLAGKVDLETPRRCSFGDIHAAQFMSASGLLSDIDAWPADVAD